MMETSIAPAEIQNDGKFLHDFVYEGNQQTRLKMAETFLTQGAGDRWVFVYGFASSHIQDIHSDVENSASQRQQGVIIEKENERTNKSIDLINKYVEDYELRKFILSDTESQKTFGYNSSEELENDFKIIDDMQWIEIEQHFGVNDNPDLLEITDWLQDMIRTKKILVHNRDDFYKLTGQQGNYFNSGFSVLRNDETSSLVITADLIPESVSPQDILLSLGHEKAHVFHNNDRISGSKNIGDMEAILKEFYAICEEWRLYRKMSDLQKDNVSATSKDFLYEVDPGNRKYIGKLPFSNIEVAFTNDIENTILLHAYNHSLQQDIGMRKRMLTSLVSNSEDKAKAQTYWGNILHIGEYQTPQVVTHKELNWKLAD